MIEIIEKTSITTDIAYEKGSLGTVQQNENKVINIDTFQKTILYENCQANETLQV